MRLVKQLDFASMEGSTGEPCGVLGAPMLHLPTHTAIPAVTLDWWAASGLPVRYSKAALHSLSRTGNVRLLDWWKHSRFALQYDKEVIIIATRHGQTASLTWWLESGLDMEYRYFDIEEALEDSVAGKDRAQKWWEALGYDASMNANEWTKLRNFRLQRKVLLPTTNTLGRDSGGGGSSSSSSNSSANANGSGGKQNGTGSSTAGDRNPFDSVRTIVAARS